eukprot:Lithocolla_globosa_v1_NODE_4305_length_1466_cov_26.164422.p1 type:complete len:449 gc:universal NODE_4305_length_1466_cov_26.164422:1411-65(-)
MNFLHFLALATASVLQLTEENFDSTIAANENILVEFYAPWCGHCKNLGPKFDEAAEQLEGIAHLAAVDCTTSETVCQQHAIRGYPTLKHFRNGEATDFQGARETATIVAFMKKRAMPIVSIVSDEVEFSQSDQVVVVAHVAPEDQEGLEAFRAAATRLSERATFGAVLGQPAPVTLYKQFDERKMDYNGDMDGLVEWLTVNSIPTMDDIGPDNYQFYIDSGKPLAYLFIGDDTDRSTVGPQVEQVARILKGKMNFVYIDAAQYGGHADNLNLKVGQWPAFAVSNTENGQKFPISQDTQLTTETVLQHCEGVLSGAIKSSIKSQTPPVEQGNVVVVTGNTYADIVLQNKAVFIEFYAPWCGHCKKLAPVWDELGDALATNPDIVIAKMDYTENDLPADSPFQIKGFPTLKFFSADNSVVEYEGDRSLEGFLEFVESKISKKDTTERDEL